MKKQIKKYWWIALVAISLGVMGSIWYPLFDAVLNQELPQNSSQDSPKELYGIGNLILGKKIPDGVERTQIQLEDFKGSHSLNYIPEKHPSAEFSVVRSETRQCLVATNNGLIGAVECEPRTGVNGVDIISKWQEIYPDGIINETPAIGIRTFSYNDKESHKIAFNTYREFLTTTKESINKEKNGGVLNEYKILVVIEHGNNRWTERMTDLSILPPWSNAHKKAMIETRQSTEQMIDLYLSESSFIDNWLMDTQWYMKFLIHQNRIPHHLLNL